MLLWYIPSLGLLIDFPVLVWYTAVYDTSPKNMIYPPNAVAYHQFPQDQRQLLG